MSLKNNPSNNQNLLDEIEKMLSVQWRNRDYLKHNALLGFCAQIIAMQPKASANYRENLKQKLIVLHPQKKKADWKQKITTLRFLIPSRELLTLRTAYICLSLVLFITLGIINPWHPDRKNVFSNPKPIILSEINSIPATNDLSRVRLENNLTQNYRILKEHREFKLIEYTLFDGSKIIAVENILL